MKHADTTQTRGKSLAYSLTRLMRERGLDDVLLAAEFRRQGASVTPMAIRYWREGRHEPRVQHCQTLAKIFKVSISELLS